jgi:hypothetical membrane protein
MDQKNSNERVQVSRSTLCIPMVGVLFFIACWTVSAMMHPTWQFFVDWPSDLGAGSSPGQLFFNIGLTVAGLGLGWYGLRMFPLNDNVWYRVSFIVMSVSGVMLAGVGVFNSDVPYIHETCAMSGFSLFMMSVLFFGVYLIACRKYAWGAGAVLIVVLFGLSGLFITVQAWDNEGVCMVNGIALAISIAVERYRLWDRDVPPFAPLEARPCRWI